MSPSERWINPVAWKDLLTYGKAQKRGSQLLGLLLCLGLLGFAWCMLSLPGPWRFAARPALLLVAALMALFHFAVAIPAATSLALERDRDTLDGLAMSPLTPWRLVTGKWAAALIHGALSKVGLLPALALAYALGGAELTFLPLYLLVLVASDASLAAFALLVGARHLEAPRGQAWLRGAPVNQSQLAMQQTLGMAVLLSLAPIYGALLLVPLAAQHGAALRPVLDALAPLGVLHPLATLLLWGEVPLLGQRVPLWLLSVAFHLLLTLPLLSAAAEAQRPAHVGVPGRLTRLLALPPLALILLVAGSALGSAPPLARSLVAVGLPALLVLWTASRTALGAHPAQDPRAPDPRRALLSLVQPGLLLQSSVTTAPGFVLLVAALTSPLLLWGAGGGAPAWSAALALALVGVALAAVGVRLEARRRRRDDEAFVAALGAVTREAAAGAQPAGEEDGASSPGDGEGEAAEGLAPAREANRVRGLLLLATVVLPLLTGTGAALARGNVAALEPFGPLLVVLTGLGLAANPLCALLPVLADPRALGTDVPLQLLEHLGLPAPLLFGAHLALYGLLLALSLATLPRPIDTERALAEALAAAEPPIPEKSG